MNIDAKTVMKLRQATGAGMMDCKAALTETGGDFEKAKDVLRAKGQKTAAKKSGRATKEGAFGFYMHHDRKLCGVVELQCETDFVARNEKFVEFANKLAMHVVAISPPAEYLTRDQVPADILSRERAVYREQVADKPAQIQDKIIDGKMEAFFKERVLMDQDYAMDPDVGSVSKAIEQHVAKLGENMRIARFAKYVLGEADAE